MLEEILKLDGIRNRDIDEDLVKQYEKLSEEDKSSCSFFVEICDNNTYDIVFQMPPCSDWRDAIEAVKGAYVDIQEYYAQLMIFWDGGDVDAIVQLNDYLKEN